MDLLVAALVVAVAILAYRVLRARAARPKPLRNNAVAGLTTAALRRLLEKVETLDRAGEAVSADASIWRMDGDNLIMKDGVPIAADDIVGAAVDFAAVKARAHGGAPLTEPVITEWLQEGVSKAIAQFVLCGLERAQERMKIMTRTSPPPTPAELAEMRAANARERAEMDKLLGSSDDSSALPTARLRK